MSETPDIYELLRRTDELQRLTELALADTFAVKRETMDAVDTILKAVASWVLEVALEEDILEPFIEEALWKDPEPDKYLERFKAIFLEEVKGLDCDHEAGLCYCDLLALASKNDPDIEPYA